MKKSLLFIIAFVIGFTMYAQKTATLTPQNARAQAPKEFNPVEPEHFDNPASQPEYIPRSYKGSNAAVKKVILGTSLNAYTLLVQEQTCMYYNKELDAIMGTFRGNQTAVAPLPNLGTGNTIINYFSSDAGETFTGKIAFSETGVLPRYPSGVLFNTTGNTTLNLAYTAIAGPEATGPWALTYLGSMQVNQDKKNTQTVATSSYAELVRQGMNACTDGMVHIAGMKYPTTYFDAAGVVKNGTFNPTTFAFDWTEVTVPLPFLHKASDGTLDASFGYANMAWNKSGTVGYVMFLGVDTTGTGKRGFYPIVFKSVDKGATWNKMPYFDFSTFPEVQNHLLYSAGPANSDPAVPWFWEADIVVDNSDNPHIMALLKSHVSTHPDSLNWYSANEPGPIMEFSYERNQWLCHYVTTPKTHEVTGDESPYVTSPPPNVGWDMRLQASRTDDGTKVFAVWTDTDWQAWGQVDSINLNPDVMIWGRDVVTNKSTQVKNITNLEEGWGECHFMFASPIAIDKAGVYTVPVSISDIYTSSLNADAPIAHYYLHGVTLSDADFTIVGTKPVAKTETLEVTSYPNPAINGKTNISVNLERSAPVSIVINSVTGQQVSRISYGTMSAGSQTLPVDASNLKRGIYFYTVTVGNQKATNKLVIK